LALLKQIEADLAKSPNDITFQLQHAAMMGRLKRYEQQVVEADNLLKRDPRLREAYVIRSDGQANQQRYAEAIASLDKAFALGAPTPKLLLFKGSYLKNEKRYKEAIETLTQVIDAEPSNVIAYNFRSVCYFQLNGPCEQALHDMEKVVLLNPSDSKAVALVADLKRELKSQALTKGK
jgi:tetratricopeptide (TPR) repeat protein